MSCQEHLLKIDFLNKEQVVKLASGTHLADLQLGKKEILLVQIPGAIIISILLFSSPFSRPALQEAKVRRGGNLLVLVPQG